MYNTRKINTVVHVNEKINERNIIDKYDQRQEKYIIFQIIQGEM